MAQIPNAADADPRTLRIYKLMCDRRGISEAEWNKIFGIKSLKTSSAKWRYIEAGLNFMDAIGSDDNLYIVCPHCNTRNPLDRNHKGKNFAELAADDLCENCGKSII